VLMSMPASDHFADAAVRGMLAVALTVGEQWRVGRHSPTRCPVSFGLGFTPEDHWRPVASAAESCVNGHFC
jgi:hypothetical protein